MRSKVAERILANTPEDVIVFVRMYGDLIVRINTILKEKGYTQKSLADKMDKKPSEIHKWLSGEHNFTLRSLAKLEAELGEPLIEVSKLPIKKNKKLEGKTDKPKRTARTSKSSRNAMAPWSRTLLLKTEKAPNHAG